MVLSHCLSNIEITKYFSFEPKFIDIFSRDNLPRIKDGAYVMNLDDKRSIRISWVVLFIDKNKIVYFDSFEMKYILQDLLNKTKDKSITSNIFRM